jgi:hypothetical protein
VGHICGEERTVSGIVTECALQWTLRIMLEESLMQLPKEGNINVSRVKV